MRERREKAKGSARKKKTLHFVSAGRGADSGSTGGPGCVLRFADGLRRGGGGSGAVAPEPMDDAAFAVQEGLRKGLLTARQRQALAASAAMAYRMAGRHSGLSFDEWRHELISSLTGKGGIRDLHQRDFKKVAGELAKLRGKEVEAFRKFQSQRAAQDRELAIAKLEREEAAADATRLLPVPARQYMDGFFKNRRTTRAWASPKLLIHGVFTLRRRLVQLRKQQKGG